MYIQMIYRCTYTHKDSFTHRYIHTYTYIHKTTKYDIFKYKQQTLLIRYVRRMYLTMQFAQKMQSIYLV